MKYGFVLEGGEPRHVANLAAEAEAAGWDAVFVADAVAIETPSYPTMPWYNSWVMLAAIALKTERIRLGTMITAVPRRRPWDLAKETATIDHLSDGRFIFGVGLGAAEHDGGFYKVGEPMDLPTRAQKLDEGLEIINGLWSGKPCSFAGAHYRVDAMTMLPPVRQTPRPPVWVVGVWPKPKSIARTLRWDGIIPQVYGGDPTTRVTPDDVREMRRMADERPVQTPFDIVIGGSTPGNKPKKAVELVRPLAEAGATWWLESMWGATDEKLRKRIQQGPPPWQT